MLRFKHAFLTMLLLALFSGSSLYAFSPIQIRCGKIINLQLVDSVPWDWKTEDYGPVPMLEDGEKFATLSVILDKDRSIGKYDYTLSGHKCLGMAVMQNPFSPAKWEQKYSGPMVEVKLVYKVKETESPFTLMFELTSREPIKKITTQGELNLLATTPAPAAATPAPAATTTPGTTPGAAPPANATTANPAAAVPAPVTPGAAAPAPAAPAAPAVAPTPAPAAVAAPKPATAVVAPKPAPKPASKPAPKPAPAEKKSDILDDW